jgi:hypothetical protein
MVGLAADKPAEPLPAPFWIPSESLQNDFRHFVVFCQVPAVFQKTQAD